jgi:hypothetical protein
VNYITKFDELVSSLPAAVSWTELESRLRVLNAQAHGDNLRFQAQRTQTGWLITIENEASEQMLTWRLSAPGEQREALHAWPVEALVRRIQLVSGGYAAAGIDDLAGAWRELSVRRD